MVLKIFYGLAIIVFLFGNMLVGAQTNPPNALSESVKDNAPGDTTVMTDIHDIKSLEPIGIQPGFLHTISLIFIALLTVMLLCTGIWFWRKRQGLKTALPPALPPDQKALKQLNRISELINTDGKEFYFQLSLIFRDYLQERFGLHAPEMTTEELVPHVEKLEVNREIKGDMKRFLRSSDPIKFAGVPPDTNTMQNDLEAVITIIQKTTPSSITEDSKTNAG